MFADRDGQQWRVWSVQPSASSFAVRPAYQEGWLCFEKIDGSCRCRLPAADVPVMWDSLSDEGLEALREIAGTA